MAGWLLSAGVMAAALVAAPAAAQVAPSGRDVVVQGVRSRPSAWREVETNHVILVSDGPVSETIRLARNLERLHFLLTGLMGRTGVTDDTIKLRITLIGDVAEFTAMDLQNRRWQQGPFNDLFQLTRYYDPRESGSVMATTRVDQRTVIERTTATPEQVLGTLAAQNLNTGGNAADQAALAGALVGDFATAGMRGSHDLTVTFGEHAIEVPAESLLYAGYAQHFLLTYFPAAYPRWYLDGFGQIFASLAVKGDHVLEFGRSPRGTGAVLTEYGGYPLGRILDDSYLTANPNKTEWTPIHAWLLTHFLLFSDTRRPQLNRYLALRASGADAATAAAVFGDQKQLTRELRAYFGARKPYEQVVYPPSTNDDPVLRRLSESEAAFVKGQLELGSRVLIPPAPAPGLDTATAKTMTRQHNEAVAQRDRWLKRLRGDAAHWSREPQAQLLLAEAECRSGNGPECLAAADRATALAPGDARSLGWRGMALVLEAAAASPADRPARLAAARTAIAAANRADVEAVVPLDAYYASFADLGTPPSTTALDAMQKIVSEVPNAPAPRLKLAQGLAERGRLDAARQVILPVAAGAYDSPERDAARDVLARTAAAASPPGAGSASAP